MVTRTPDEVCIKRLKTDYAPEKLFLEKRKRHAGALESVEREAKKRNTTAPGVQDPGIIAPLDQPFIVYQRKTILPAQGARKASARFATRRNARSPNDSISPSKPPNNERKVYKIDDTGDKQPKSVLGKRQKGPILIAEADTRRTKFERPTPAAEGQASPFDQSDVGNDVRQHEPAIGASQQHPVSESTSLAHQSQFSDLQQYPTSGSAANQHSQAFELQGHLVLDRDREAKGPAQAFKRPGRSSGFARRTTKPAASEDHGRVEFLANQLHDFALEVSAEEKKPRSVARPKLSGQRSLEIHRERLLRNQVMKQSNVVGEPAMEPDDEYVYETYLLVDESGISQASLGDMRDVGYIMITEEDEALWEEYLEDVSEKDWNSEEEDENAEDYYAADYPDDELASDDEFDRGAYNYRTGASDDEEFDRATWSDDEAQNVHHSWRRGVGQSYGDDSDSDED